MATITFTATSIGRAADGERPATTNSLGMKLRLLPAGHFQMGEEDSRRPFTKRFNSHAQYRRDDEWPRHPVRLTKPFYVAETEVTVGQFKRFVEASRYRTTAETNGAGIDGFQPVTPKEEPHRVVSFEQRAAFTWRSPGFAQTDDHPVVGVSHDDAKAFCKWLSEKEGVAYRLPTEAEWEFACRAGSDTWYSWGDDFAGVIHKQANAGNVELEKAYPKRVSRQWLINIERDPGDGHIFTAPVGSFPANAWGLRDMHGNVWEWCEDHYGDTYYKTFERERYNTPVKLAIDPINTTPWNEHGAWRVIRGGCWYTAPVQCRSQTRAYFDATDAGCYLGFRVVREAAAQEVAAARKVFDREQEATRLVVEKAGPFMAGEVDHREGLRTVIKPEMNVGPHLRSVPGLVDIVVNRSNMPVTAALLADIAAVDGLRSLSLQPIGDELRDADLAPLASKIKLERLMLNDESKLTNASLDHIAGLTQLRELRLGVNAFTDPALAKLSRLKKLQTLSLIGTASTGESLAAFDGAPLEALYINQLSDAGAKHLRLFPALRTLHLFGSPLTAAGFAHAESLKQLQHLDLSGCNGLDEAAFAPLAKLHDLQQLNLEGTGAGDRACRQMSTLTKLSDIHIGSPALTDAGLEDLGRVVSLKMVRITAPATITDRGVRHLWRLDQLWLLIIESPGVTGATLHELTDLKSLRSLTLDGIGTTDAGMKQIPLLPHVEHLRLGSNRGGPPGVTDAGLLLLADAPKLRLLEVTVRGTKITDAGIEALKRAAPNMTVRVH